MVSTVPEETPNSFLLLYIIHLIETLLRQFFTYEEALAFVRSYETKTASRFSVYYSRKDFGNTGILLFKHNLYVNVDAVNSLFK